MTQVHIQLKSLEGWGGFFFRLGVELTFRIVNVVLFVKFVSPERLEMKQELSCLNVNKKKQITSGMLTAGGFVDTSQAYTLIQI